MSICLYFFIVTKYFFLPQECDEYSKIMKRPLLLGPKSVCGWNYVPNCGQVGFKGMILGGIAADPKEFPHMAGKHNNTIEMEVELTLDRSSGMDE